MTDFTQHPDGPRVNLGVPPIDTTTWNGACVAEDCEFVGDVEAAVFFMGIGPDGRTFEYLWACPWCDNEQTDEATDTDGGDS